METFQVIKKPLVTEKGAVLREIHGTYAFQVDRRANKHQIKGAVEQLFNVHVTQVRTLIVRGKIKRVGRSTGKRSNWKKALVTLKQGEKIEFFEGV